AGHGTRVEGSEVLERLRAQSRARLCRRLQSDGNTGESTARLRLAKARRDQGCDTVRNTFEGPCDRRSLLGGGAGRTWLPLAVQGRVRRQLSDRDAVDGQRLSEDAMGSRGSI